MPAEKKKIKKRYVFSIIALLTLSYYIFTGGIIVYFGDEFNYVLPPDYDCSKPDPPKEKRIYIPDDYHFRFNETEIPTLLYVWSVNYHRLPCSLNLYTCDPTYLQSHELYEKFCINEIVVTYSNGDSNHFNIENREFLGKEHLIEGKIVSIPNILQKPMDVKIQLNGYTRRKSGEIETFTKTSEYTYKKFFKIYTLWEFFASV